MSEEARVELAGNENEKTQWFHKLLYSLDGRKLKVVGWKVKWFAIAVFALPLGYLLFQGPQQQKTKSQVEPVQGVYESKPVNVPEAAATQSGGKNGDAKKQGKLQHFLGSQIIIRPFMDTVPPGSMVKAKLISGASNGLVRVELMEPVSINGETVADVGSVLLGRGTSTEDRLLIHFKKLMSKEGAAQSISAEACDGEDKIAGIKGAKVGRTALKLAGSIGLGFIGGMAEGLQQTSSQYGMEIKEPSLKNAALNGTSQAALDQSHEMMNSLKEQRPVIEVKAGTVIYVLFESNPKGDDTND
jgi:hypothetical protein